MEKALIIEGDRDTRELVKKVLDKEGFETLLAAGGQEGMEIFKKEKPPLVIVGLKMADIGGMEILSTVKASSPETEVIVIAGRGDYDAAIQTLMMGALDYLKRPVDASQLIIAVERYRARSAKKEELAIPPTVLIVDDEEVITNRLEKVLSKEGYRVFKAADGEEGVKVFMDTKIDVVLADIKMPKKNGMEALHEIKSLSEDVEVIMITGYGDEDTAIQAMREGAINYIRKPIDIDQLLAAIEKALEKLDLRRSLLCRTRDLELAREASTRITREGEITVDVLGGLRGEARTFAHRLIDSLPFSLFAVDKEENVVFANAFFTRLFEGEPEKIKKEWPEKLSRIGIKGTAIESFKKGIAKLFESERNEIETIIPGRHVHIILTKISAVTEMGKVVLVLVILRGGLRP